MQSRLEHQQIQCAAFRALTNEYDLVLKAAMQGTPLDARLVRLRLANIEMMYDPAAQIDSSAPASCPLPDASSAPA